MEVEGKIVHIGDVETFGNNGFRKRLLVVMTDEQYPQEIPVEFVQDKVDLLDKVDENDKVVVSVNLRGRKWTNPEGEDKWFGTIQGWRIESSGNSGNAPVSKGKKKKEAADDDDDLPF